MRGCHANRDRVRVDNGKEKSEVVLDSSHTALYLEKMVWKEMFEFSNDAILVVATNTLYDESEYVRDYGEFLNIIKI